MKFKTAALALAVSATLSFSAQAEDLMDIYKEALQRDTAVLQAKAEADAAHAAISEATAALLPQIDVIGDITKNHTNVVKAYDDRASNKVASAKVTLSQTIWRHSSWANRSIAEKNATLKDLAYSDALQNLIIRVSTAYFNVLQAADTLEYMKANSIALRKQLDTAEKRLQVGVIAETDKLEAQAAYDLSCASVITAENELINSYEDLRLLIGRSLTEKDLAKLDATKFDTPAVQTAIKQIIKDAENNNLKLQQAVVARDIAKDQITLAQSGHEPTLDLHASMGTQYTDYSAHNPQAGFVDNNSWNRSVGLTLNVPIYHGGATSAASDKAQAMYIAQSEILENAHRTLIANINNNYNNVNAAISSVKAYNNTVKSAASALEATEAGYDVGTRTMTDVLDATRNLYNALQKQAAARYNYINSRLALLYAEGGLKVEHISQVNDGLKK